MNYVAIKGSGLRRCKLVMPLRSTKNIISRSVFARDGNRSRVISWILMNSF